MLCINSWLRWKKGPGQNNRDPAPNISSWLSAPGWRKTEHEFDPPSHLFKPINDREQMKTLWAALNAQTLLRRAFSASWLIDVSLPPRPLCRYRVCVSVDLAILGSLLAPSWCSGAKHGGQWIYSTGPRDHEERWSQSILDALCSSGMVLLTQPLLAGPPGSRTDKTVFWRSLSWLGLS